MRVSKLFGWFLCLVLFCGLSAPLLMAGIWNEATKLTFNQPVEIPGRVLPAGTYWFSLMNDDSERNMVRVWNSDRTQLVATIRSVPDYRLKPKGRTVIKFEELKPHTPEALQAWFYPGDDYGHEFVYPEDHARELAQRTGKAVLSMNNDLAPNITKPSTSVNDPSVQALKQANVKAITPNGQQTDVAKAVQLTPQASTKPATANR